MSLLKTCFPPTKQKKKAYKESCIVQKVLLENPGIYISTSIFDTDVLPNQDSIDIAKPSSIQRTLSRISEWFYQQITRSWDKGDPSTLSTHELEHLMKKYHYKKENTRA